MQTLGLVLFGVFLLVMVILNISMIISLLKPGDERRQMSVNPFSTLASAATIYFICLFYYRKKYGG